MLYIYDKTTNEYIGKMKALLDPLESLKQGKEVYSIPPYTTLVEPKEPEPGKVNVYDSNAGEWILREDHRGEVVYNKKTGAKVLVTGIGELSSDLTNEKPVILEDLKTQRKQEVNDLYKKAVSEGCKLFDEVFTVADFTKVSEALRSSGPFNLITFETTRGIVALTRPQVNNIYQYLYNRKTLLDLRKKSYIDKINGVTDKKDIQKFDISFDISKELREMAGLSVTEINNYFVGEV